MFYLLFKYEHHKYFNGIILIESILKTRNLKDRDYVFFGLITIFETSC